MSDQWAAPDGDGDGDGDAAAEVVAPPISSTTTDARDGLDPGPIEDDLAGVDAALERLDAGTYGTCEVCRDPLPDDVLTNDPMARFCVGHLAGTLS